MKNSIKLISTLLTLGISSSSYAVDKYPEGYVGGKPLIQSWVLHSVTGLGEPVEPNALRFSVSAAHPDGRVRVRRVISCSKVYEGGDNFTDGIWKDVVTYSPCFNVSLAADEADPTVELIRDQLGPLLASSNRDGGGRQQLKFESPSFTLTEYLKDISSTVRMPAYQRAKFGKKELEHFVVLRSADGDILAKFMLEAETI